jgi:hypothetical protein
MWLNVRQLDLDLGWKGLLWLYPNENKPKEIPLLFLFVFVTEPFE